MAFSVQAIYSGGTISLTNKSPYGLLSARGMAGAPARRVTSRGPNQDGDSDKGYRLQPRNIELEIGIYGATTDAILDGYRDQLMTVFKPLSATPVYLRVTRDDAEVRQLDSFTVGGVKIDWVKEHRPGHFHKATVRLYAPDVAYYDTTPGTVTVTGASSGTAADWYLAGGAIGTAQVLMSGGTPTQGQAWSYGGTIPHGSTWTLAFRTTQEAITGTVKYAFHVANTGLNEANIGLITGLNTAQGYLTTGFGETGAASLGSAFMPAGTSNYFIRHDPDGVALFGFPSAYKQVYYNSGSTYVTPAIASDVEEPISGTARRWRSNSTNTASSRWTAPIYLYALYSPGLSETQVNILSSYMAGAIGGTAYISVPLTYAGDLPEYPIISVRGPITGLIMNNVATGDSIALGTTAIAAGETYVFDLRPGYKTVTAGTVNKRDKLATYSDWDEWHLTPDTPQGINAIYILGTNTSGSTQISIVYYDRYSSY